MKFPIKFNDRLFTGLILAVIAAIIALSGALVRFDNLYYDLGYYDLGRKLATSKPAPEDIVIVAIDEASLEKIGRWPWSRSIHADLINKLKAEKASVIGLDVIFSEPELNHPEADLALAKAIQEANNVVLPVLLEVPFAGARIKQSLPLSMLTEHAAALGRVHVPLDTDGIARSIYLWEGLGIANTPHFAQSVLQVAKLLLNECSEIPALCISKTGSSEQGQLVAKELRRVNFLGSPGYFKRISYAQVLSGDYPANFFKNKIVLVGATAAGLGDLLPTPVSASSQPMPGVEFHANVIESMRHSKLIKETPLWLTTILCALLAIVPLFWLPKLSPLKSLIAITLYYFLVTALAVSIPHILNYWIPPTGALVAILLAYPIWSWRKLESAHAYLDIELQNLRDDLALLGVDEAQMQTNFKEDPLQARISKVKLAAEHLRDLHRDRNDTLAFISHDIRAPLGSAMMLLNDIEKTKYSERIKQMLGRALNMADNFLQASRAEMANVSKFQTLDLVNLTHQVIDEAYEIAKEKQIKLKTTMPEESMWVSGDFGLLQRAITNVLHNAVKYSPENKYIEITLVKNANHAFLTVTDFGPGIHKEKISKLFKRFSRAEGDHQASEGSGLGLYFVDVTLKKHHGTVSVASELDSQTTFTMILPLIDIPEDLM